MRLRPDGRRGGAAPRRDPRQLSLLTGSTTLRGRTAPSRVLFGPHVTNLATPDRALSTAHTPYYARRAAGGAGLVVTEVASVHDSDHPYARAPLATACGAGWAAIAAACRPALVVAGLGHAGGQGSTAYHRRPLWAPSATPDAVSREVPVPMGAAEADAVVAGFATAARLAVDAGCDGVEIAAGQHSLLRQYLSGLTSVDPSSELLGRVLEAVRAAVDDAVVGLRLGVDELAPWAGITVEEGVATAVRVAGLVDYLVPVRGSALSVAATRPDGHTAPGFLRDTCAAVRAAVGASTAVVLAGSVVDPADADAALADGVADLVEMTRAQIADPDLVATVRAGRTPRPCVLTNQECRVRDVRDPAVSCTVAPTRSVPVPDSGGRRVTVVGGGPAGLEAARTLALAGARVVLHERAPVLGGLLAGVARLPGHARFAGLVGWWCDEMERLGVEVRLGEPRTVAEGPTVWATGGVERPAPVPATSAARFLAGPPPAPGPAAVLDPLGDAAGTGIAELLAGRGPTALVTPDPLAGKLLARRGDLADANGRLQRAGVDRVLRSVPEGWQGGVLTVRDTVLGTTRDVAAALVVDCAPRLPGTVPDGAVGAGDVIAPRTVHEAVLEGRRAAAAVLA